MSTRGDGALRTKDRTMTDKQKAHILFLRGTLPKLKRLRAWVESSDFAGGQAGFSAPRIFQEPDANDYLIEVRCPASEAKWMLEACTDFLEQWQS